MTELVFILDRSGSMAGLEADTIGGFNAMIESRSASRAQRSFPRCSFPMRARSSTTGCHSTACRP